MYNEYLAPYKAAVDAGAGSVMSSFNIVDGIPATANKWLLTDLLRNEWGFGGLLVTDYNSIAEMSSHGVAPLKEAPFALYRQERIWIWFHAGFSIHWRNP